MRPFIAVSLAAVGVVAACGGPPPVGERMFDHFARAGEIQTALIAGDLSAARRPAEWLAEYERFEGVPASSADWVAVIRGAAREVADATSIDEAADAAGRLATGCAGCHRELDEGPRFRTPYDPPEANTRITHMMRHLWAMDRMWEGLISGSTVTWAAGADAIADARPERDFPGGAETAALAARVHELAGTARAATESERPAAYSALIRTCADCHTKLNVGSR